MLFIGKILICIRNLLKIPDKHFISNPFNRFYFHVFFKSASAATASTDDDEGDEPEPPEPFEWTDE